MSSRIGPIESYYQTVFRKLLHILPYAAFLILVIQIIVRKLKLYFIAKINELFTNLGSLFYCFIEEAGRSFDSRVDTDGEITQAYERNSNNSDANVTVNEAMSPSENSTISPLHFEDSVSDVEVLRGGDSDEEDDADDQQEKELAKSIEVKRLVLQKKRQELCGRLLAYKLMEFHVDGPHIDANTGLSLPATTFMRTPPVSPIPVAEEIAVPATPASPPEDPSSSFFPVDEESRNFDCEDMLARAIQASLDDLAAKEVAESNSTPPRAGSSTGKLVGQASSEASAIRDPSVPSPSKVHQQQTTPTRPDRRPPLPPLASNILENYALDALNQCIQQGKEDSRLTEDFMEGDRYVGDKGKRPSSGRYAYKKRVKPSNSTSEDNPANSGDTPSKDSDA